MTNFEFIMRDRGITCEQIADNPSVKVTRQTVQNWRMKRVPMPEPAKVVVAKILECEPSELLQEKL